MHTAFDGLLHVWSNRPSVSQFWPGMVWKRPHLPGQLKEWPANESQLNHLTHSVLDAALGGCFGEGPALLSTRARVRNGGEPSPSGVRAWCPASRLRDTSGPNPARLQSRMANRHLLPNNDATEVDRSDVHRMIGTVEPAWPPYADCLARRCRVRARSYPQPAPPKAGTAPRPKESPWGSPLP